MDKKQKPTSRSRQIVPSDRGFQRPDQESSLLLTAERVFQFLLALRILNALTVSTFFQPDEYYQALEPAWYLAFGMNGKAWLTWEWREHLRSSLHPALFAVAYRLADSIAYYCHLDPTNRADLLLVAPKIFQAGIATIGDFYTWKLGKKIYGAQSRAAAATLILTVVSPWQWFCSTRTFSNGLETTLTIIALYHWPLYCESLPQMSSNRDESKFRGDKTKDALFTTNRKLPGLRNALLLAAVATLLRPTNIIIWVGLLLYTLSPSRALSFTESAKSGSDDHTKPLKNEFTKWHWPTPLYIFEFGKSALICGSIALLLTITGDYVFYQQFTFPPLNFLHFNVVMSLAIFYGNNDWHYYLSQGYPLLLTTAIPFTLVGMYQTIAQKDRFRELSLASQHTLRGLVVVSLLLPASLSMLAHKEVRFIYPLLPALHVFAALPLVSLFESVFFSRQTENIVSTSLRIKRMALLALLLLLNGIIAYYTSQVHNAGLIPVANYLRREFEAHYLILNPSEQSLSQNRSMSVAFLMPCHSVPWRSHLQYPALPNQPGINAWALTCEPPLHLNNGELKRQYRDEADLFYDNPGTWIRSNMAPSMPRMTLDNRGTLRRQNAGLYQADATESKNKRLWGKMTKSDNENSKSWTQNIDMVNLLPYLITKPSSVLSESVSESIIPEEDKNEVTSMQREELLNTIPQFDLELARTTGSSPSSARVVRRPWPHYLIFFEQLEPTMLTLLGHLHYRECWRGFNSHWHDDWRRKGDVIVWCLRP